MSLLLRFGRKDVGGCEKICGYIFRSNPIAPDIPLSPKQNHVGDCTSMIFGLSSMVQRAFHGIYTRKSSANAAGGEISEAAFFIWI